MQAKSSLVAVFLMFVVMLSGCEKEESTVNVDVHGVNYSGNEFFFSIMDPVRQKPSGVGEHIAPFAGGGTTCCFALPKKWQPGIKVQLWTRHWLPRGPDGKLPEVERTTTVEVPQYVDGKPGELWVIRSTDGTISVVSSNYEPDHPKWPGKVKGWPEPSIEYQRERWELYRDHEEGVVRVFTKLLRELEDAPERRGHEAWQFTKERDPASLKGFAGPDDPKYLATLKKEYEEGLGMSKQRLEELMRARP